MALVDDINDVVTLSETTQAKAEIYLKHSQQVIMNTLYPYGAPEGAVIPEKYKSLQVRIAVYMANKEGAEGESAHSEGGISRTYEDSGVPKSMLAEIVPMVKSL